MPITLKLSQPAWKNAKEFKGATKRNFSEILSRF
jgi:hypothetical protein